MIQSTTSSKLVPIGNSQGVRLPKIRIQQYNLEKWLTITPNKDGLLIMPTENQTRKWRKEQFAKSIQQEQEEEFGIQENSFDKTERTW